MLASFDTQPDWLNSLREVSGTFAPWQVWVRDGGNLVLALVFGLVVGGVYVLTHRKPQAERTSFVTTLVLLTVLIAMVTLVIEDNLARAFGLVGTLSIVRFRTVVEDTRDTAFVIFAVVVGMAVGAGYSYIAVVGIPVVGAAAYLLGGSRGTGPAAGVSDFSLTIRLGLGRDPESLLRPLFGKHLLQAKLRSTATIRQGAALEIIYLVRLRQDNDAVALVHELNQIEGIQQVELQRQ